MSCSYIIARQIFPGKSYQNVGGLPEEGCQHMCVVADFLTINDDIGR